jgi:uncharacterized protein YkwD
LQGGKMKKITSLLLLSCLFLSSCASKLEKQDNKIEKQENKIEKIEKYNQSQLLLLDLHNKQRKSKSKKELILDENLCKYAQQHAQKMAKKDSLYHSSMSSLIKVNEGAKTVGENIAYGQSTEEKAMKDWMNSTGHRWNILSKEYLKVGIGSAEDQSGKIYWCVVFSN